MTIAWMIYVLLVGGLLSVGAWCVEDALRATRLPSRWVWAGALLGTVAFAAFAMRGAGVPDTSISVLTANVKTSAGDAVQAPHGMLASVQELRSTVSRLMALPMGAATTRVSPRIVAVGMILWAAASLMLLLLHARVSGTVIRQRRAWPIANLPGGTARVAPALGPAVVGLTSPEIVVPEWLLEKSREEQRLVMVHEQEHIAARDQYLPFGALLVATLLPWHPAVWWALARLRLAVELDCDARVLRRGERAKTYGTLLIDIAARCGGHRVGAVALADRTSHLERRILAMTPRPSRFTRARSIGLAALAALAIVTACEARMPTSSEVQAMDAASAEKALAPYKVVDDRGAANVLYLVNGERVTAEQAHAIPANRIATVNIRKGEKDPTGHYGPNIVAMITYDALNSELQKTKSVAGKDGEKMKVSSNLGYAIAPTPKGMMLRKDKFDGLIYIDGVIAPEGALAKLSPDAIASIDVLKGDAARATSSDPAAANGIIKVVTKAAAKAAK